MVAREVGWAGWEAVAMGAGWVVKGEEAKAVGCKQCN